MNAELNTPTAAGSGEQPVDPVATGKTACGYAAVERSSHRHRGR